MPEKCFKSFSAAVLTACVSLLPLTAMAEVRLPKIISDHMALQADAPVAIWGWADPAERVEVRIAGQTQSVKADQTGHWRVTLKPLSATSAPLDLQVKGKSNSLRVNDILVGEVWLASGQSNMEMPFRWAKTKGTFDYQAEMAAANHPSIRIFKVKKTHAKAPQEDVEGQWIVCDPSQVTEEGFSAAGYYFARRLNATLKVPVGLIDSTWGGTRIEEWISTEGFGTQPALARFLSVEAGGEKIDGVKRSELFNAMIAPLTPFSLKGAIWYQGESNATDAVASRDYTDKMRALIGGWRTSFGQTVPFYYVQIAPYLYHVDRPLRVTSPEAAPLIWEAQTDALSIADTGMVVVNDLVDNLFDIHPRNKRDVGERLAGMALARTYGQGAAVFSGPRFKNVSFDAGKAIIGFDDVGSGLVSRDGKPVNWFAIAGADGVYYPGQAEIVGDRIVVSSPNVPVPVAVRFAWDEGAQPNLSNREGFPAWPFRSQRP